MNSDPWERYWGALWGMKEGKSSELYVPLGRNTQHFVKCPVPRFIALMGDVLPSMRGCPWHLEALSPGACTFMRAGGDPRLVTPLFYSPLPSNFQSFSSTLSLSSQKKQKLIVQA